MNRTSCRLMYAVIVCLTSFHLKIVLSFTYHLVRAIFVIYGQWVNLAIVSAWFHAHPYCTDGDILSFPFLRTNVLLIVSRCDLL